MKRILVIAILMIASVNVMNAQDNIHFGVTAGLNLANIGDLPAAQSGETLPTTSMIVGFNVGGTVNYGINDNFSLEGSLLYYTCGSKFTTSVPAQSTTSGFPGILTTTLATSGYSAVNTYNLSYLQIPIMAKYSLTKDEGLNFFAGPTFGILLSATDNADAYSVTTTTTTTTGGIAGTPTSSTLSEPSASNKLDTASAMSGLDIGLVLGVGYQLPNGLGFSVKYNLGLTTIFKAESQSYTVAGQTFTTSEPAWGKNGVIGISVSYMFGMGK